MNSELERAHEQLASNRAKIRAYLGDEHDLDDRNDANDDGRSDAFDEPPSSANSASNVISTLAEAISEWWAHHPVSVAANAAAPTARDVIRQHPKASLASAAALGAIVMLIPAVRRAAVGAVAIGLVKSSGAKSALWAAAMSLLAKQRTSTQHYPTRKE